MQKSSFAHHQNSSANTPYTMSSSTSNTPPQVEPPTTIKTKSSFSEIEQLVSPHHTSKNHSYIPSQLQTHQQTEPFVSPLTETNLNYHKSNFPPSRETKYRYVDSFIQNQKLLLEQELELQRKTKAEIQSLIPLDTKSIDEELVRDDQQHYLWNGYLWPLAHSPCSQTPSSHDTPRRRHSIQTQHQFSNHHEEQNSTLPATENEQHSRQHINGDTSSSKKPWMKTLTRWIRLGQIKKHDDCDQKEQQSGETAGIRTIASNENDNVDLNADASLSSSSAPAPAPESTSTSAPIPTTMYDFYGPYRRQARKAARHVSWSGGTSFENYKQQKSYMIEEGLYGLSNANIARALGSSQQGSRAPFLFLPPRETTTMTTSPTSAYTTDPSHSMDIQTPAPTPELHDHADSPTSSTSSIHQKKEPSNMSFVQQTLSSAKSLLRPRKSIRKKTNHVDPQPMPTDDNNNNNNHDDNDDDDDDDNEHCGAGILGDASHKDDSDTAQQQKQQKQEKERRRRTIHVNGRYSPSLSALKEEELTGTTGSSQNLVAFRYPKMVRIKDLRDVAIQILSTTDTYRNEDIGNDDGDGVDYMTMIGCSGDNGGGRGHWLARDKEKWKMKSNNLNGSDGEHGDDEVDKWARRYRSSIKRFSDPGTYSLPPPPFSIGRPLSSLYY